MPPPIKNGNSPVVKAQIRAAAQKFHKQQIQRVPGLQTEPIYRTVWNALDLPGRPPPVQTLAPSKMPWAGGGPAWGIQPNRGRDVFIQPKVAKGIRNLAFGGTNTDPLRVLIHEYAHVAQPDMQRRKWIEGGAEAFAQNRTFDVLKRLGLVNELSVRNMPPGQGWGGSYPHFVSDVWRRPDAMNFIENRQFGR